MVLRAVEALCDNVSLQVNNLEKRFHGNMTCAEAELSLNAGINGSRAVYSISLRCDRCVFHYCIHMDPQHHNIL